MNSTLKITTFSVFIFFLAAMSYSKASETNFSNDCEVITPQYSNTRFLEPERNALMHVRAAACKKVQKKDWQLERANKVVFNYVMYHFKCNRNKLDWQEKTRLEEYYKEKQYDELSDKLPDALISSEEHFCRSVFDPTKWPYFDSSKVRTRTEWLQNEYFCLISYHTANADTFLEKFYSDLPSDQKFKARVDELCSQLRSDQITRADAFYYFQIEIERWMSDSAPEEAKRVLKSIKEPVKKLWGLMIK